MAQMQGLDGNWKQISLYVPPSIAKNLLQTVILNFMLIPTPITTFTPTPQKIRSPHNSIALITDNLQSKYEVCRPTSIHCVDFSLTKTSIKMLTDRFTDEHHQSLDWTCFTIRPKIHKCNFSINTNVCTCCKFDNCCWDMQISDWKYS